VCRSGITRAIRSSHKGILLRSIFLCPLKWLRTVAKLSAHDQHVGGILRSTLPSTAWLSFRFADGNLTRGATIYDASDIRVRQLEAWSPIDSVI
jgi:hypothetical protein